MSAPKEVLELASETGTHEAYSRDPRGITRNAEKYLAGTDIADSAVFGPEAKFFIFDNVQIESKINGDLYTIDPEEAIWNTIRDEAPKLSGKIRHTLTSHRWRIRSRTSVNEFSIISTFKLP